MMNFPPSNHDGGEDRAMIASESDPPLAGPPQASSISPSRTARRGADSSLPAEAGFSFRKVTLDGPVAPLLAHVTAPFAKKSRKKAFMAASYYSECFLNGITPIEADTAAAEAQNRYDKWWKSTKFSNCSHESAKSHQPERPGKRQKLLFDQRSSPSDVPSIEAITYKRRLSLEGSVVSSEDDSTPHDSNQLTSSSEHNRHHHHNKRQLVLDSEISVIRQVDSHCSCSSSRRFEQSEINRAKAALVQDLKSSGGDTSRPQFLSSLDFLEACYAAQGCDARWTLQDGTSPCTSDGAWLNLSKPTFSDCLGQNEKGQYIYTLGRLAFDMFRPTNLRCILRGVFNAVGLASDDDVDGEERPRSFPSGMYMPSSVGQQGRPVVRNNDIVVSFTIEADQTRRGQPASSQKKDGADLDEYIVRRPIRGLLTNHGYCVPDPNVPNRLSVWFSGGSLEVQDEIHDLEEWKHLFDENEAPRRDLGELARVLAARCLLGAHLPHSMDEDGSLTYFLKRPIGGHSQVFVDVLYCDKTLRIVRGHRGSIYASIRSL